MELPGGPRLLTRHESSIIVGGGEWLWLVSSGEWAGIWRVQNRGGDGDAWGAYNGNREHLERLPWDAELAARIEQLEAERIRLGINL